MKTLFQLLNIVVDTTMTDSTALFLKQISNNTENNVVWSGLQNINGWVTIVVAIAALVFAILTYIAQQSTEKHTKKSEAHSKNAPYKAQDGILRDIPRHLYRNLICTIAMIKLYEQKRKEHAENNSKTLRYPSEANVLKLQTLPEEILLKMDLDEEKCEEVYKKMHETTLLFRNYNTEIQAASEHFKRANIDEESLYFDYDNLLFKPLNLTAGIIKLSEAFSKMNEWGSDKLNQQSIMCIIIAEHIVKGNLDKKPNNDDIWEKLENDNFLDTYGLPKITDVFPKKEKEPLIRSFKNTFGANPKIDRNTIITTVTNIVVKDKPDKLVKFITHITADSKESIYGKVFCKDTYMIDFWNLFKIMCYLDSKAEESKIGMINVA